MKSMKEMVLGYIDDLIVCRTRKSDVVTTVDDVDALVADIQELKRIRKSIEKEA